MPNASVLKNRKCCKCGWPVVFLLCNKELMTTPPYSNFDYWEYCANKTCEHHEGQGIYSATGNADFVEVENV